jgi:hypothetical protein
VPRNSRISTRKILTALSVVAMAAAAALPGSAATADSAAACDTQWGSLPKRIPWQHSILTDVRAGQHACFDRLVLDGGAVAWVSYVDQVSRDGSGHAVPVRGGARLEIVTSGSIEGEPWEAGFVPADPDEVVDVAGWRTFRQVAHAGEFEGHLTLGLGVRARLPFRIFLLSAPGVPPRVVIDVAHRW